MFNAQNMHSSAVLLLLLASLMWASPLHAIGAEDDSWTTDDFSSFDTDDIDDDTLLETSNSYQKGDARSRVP
jgi:hypothetical protein